MKTRDVATITSNEEDARLRIFDGTLPIEDAAYELIRMERAQHDSERMRHDETIKRLCEANKALRSAGLEPR